MLNSCKLGCLALGVLLAACGTASAQIWAEVGDAPVRPAFQATVGVGPLFAIVGHGQFDPTGLIDVDMYCVHIDTPTWSASTLGGATWDTMLALYAMDGVTQLRSNDDFGSLQSFISDSSGGSATVLPGHYILGITRFADFGWDDIGGQGTSDYRIELVGMSYCDVPTPGAFSLLGLGGLAIARRRR